MKHLVVLLTVVVLVLSMSVADAQWYRNMARGDTALAAPSFSTAWLANPAVLAGASAPADGALMPMAPKWHNEASADIEVSGDTDIFSVDWGGYNLGNGWGMGAGYADANWGQEYGAAAARKFGGWSIGLGWLHTKMDTGMAYGGAATAQAPMDDSQDFLQLGVYKYFDWAGRGDSSIAGVHAGAVWWDLTDEVDRVVDLGIAVDFVQGWTLAVDVLDFDVVNVGASTRIGKAKEYEVAAGLSDGDLTLGATYDLTRNPEGGNWRVGIAWADYEMDDVAQAGVGYVW